MARPSGRPRWAASRAAVSLRRAFHLSASAVATWAVELLSGPWTRRSTALRCRAVSRFRYRSSQRTGPLPERSRGAKPRAGTPGKGPIVATKACSAVLRLTWPPRARTSAKARRRGTQRRTWWRACTGRRQCRALRAVDAPGCAVDVGGCAVDVADREVAAGADELQPALMANAHRTGPHQWSILIHALPGRSSDDPLAPGALSSRGRSTPGSSWTRAVPGPAPLTPCIPNLCHQARPRSLRGGAAGVWWPIRSSKPAGPGNPRLGWFDSIAAPWPKKPRLAASFKSPRSLGAPVAISPTWRKPPSAGLSDDRTDDRARGRVGGQRTGSSR